MRSSWNRIVLFIFIAIGCNESDSGQSNISGQGGSLARFAINGTFLYIASKSSISVFDIAGSNFEEVNSIEVGFGLETIFAKGEYLYLGASDAMYIYSIENPALPSFIFRYLHIISCDPVVVQGTRAFVTLSSGSRCNRGTNLLEVIDITDPYNPNLLGSYPMNSPGGLGIDGNCLFVCEGEHGLKMLDVENPSNINVINEVKDVNAYDVIVSNGIVKLTGQDGIFQYQYNCSAKEISLLSTIPVHREVQ
jgi:hypothetical protein